MEYFLQLVKENNFEKAEEVIEKATGEYEQIKKEINLTSRNNLDAIDKILTCVKNKSPRSALLQIDEAWRVYNAHVKPFLAGKKSRVEDKPDPNVNRRNRPTETAERSTELYDNEWTDAYEENKDNTF